MSTATARKTQAKANKAKAAAVAKPEVKKAAEAVETVTAELMYTGKEIEYEDIWRWVQENAGGNEANVEIVPLENVHMDSSQPVPFGYGGTRGGVRETIQNWMIFGVPVDDNNPEGPRDRTLKTVLNRAAKHGHSRRRPVCLHALMHGGYSPSSKYWGTPYVKLVVRPRPVSEGK